MDKRSWLEGGRRAWPVTGKAGTGARRREPVSAACDGRGVSSMSSPAKEKLNPDISVLGMVT